MYERLIAEAVKRSVDALDTTELQKVVDAELKKYIKSAAFKEDLQEGLSEEGLGFSIGESLVGPVAKCMKSAKVTLS
jgi:hypothetical protein